MTEQEHGSVAMGGIPSPLDRLEGSDLDHLIKLLDEARLVYQAAEKAGVDVQIGYYRRLSAGKDILSALAASEGTTDV